MLAARTAVISLISFMSSEPGGRVCVVGKARSRIDSFLDTTFDLQSQIALKKGRGLTHPNEWKG